MPESRRTFIHTILQPQCSAFLLSVLATVIASPTLAMSVMKRDFPELVARAEQIVVGTVSSVREAEDNTGTPMTHVTLSDVTYLKGGGGPTMLTVRFYGGTAGSVTVRIPDMPTFNVGERDVLFIRNNGHDICPLVGGWQGRFRVRYDQERSADVIEDNSGRPIIQLVGRELVPVARQADTNVTPTPVTAVPMTLDEFQQLIREELAHPHPIVAQ